MCKFHFTFTHSRSEDGGAGDGDERHSPATWSIHLLVELSSWAGHCTVTGPQTRFRGEVHLLIDVNTQDALSSLPSLPYNDSEGEEQSWAITAIVQDALLLKGP